MIFVFLCLTHFTQYDAVQVYPHCCKWHYFILFFLFFFFLTEKYSSEHTHHILFPHSSVDGHSVCFCVLAIANRASVNIRVRASFWTTFFSMFSPDTCPRMELLDHMVALFLLSCVCAQSHLAFCDAMNCSLPASSVQGIFQARILKWVAIARILPDPGIIPTSLVPLALASRFLITVPPGKPLVS